MKFFALGIAIACAMTVGSGGQDLKHVLTAMPDGKGRLRLEATHIDKDWTASVVHLKGNVRMEIWTTAKNPGQAMVLRADEVDYHENTGEISPRGNVRLTVEDAK
jgi:lipopolysaccharide assembly outer membrane protein LptD (OstA)